MDLNTRLPSSEERAMQQETGRPEVSVVIPAYNRGPLVRRMLEQLTRQDVPAGSFEVIVSDDGSSDDTEAVVREFADRLRVGYHFQEDLGMRVGLARNEGARLASGEILVFLDAGAMVGPDYVRRHRDAHADPAVRRMVAGYAWGYNPLIPPVEGLAEALETLPPEEVLAELRDDPDLRDVRHPFLAERDFALEEIPLAWRWFFTNNCSVRAEDFWAAGGFDESFVKWGAEDLELGLRLERHGLTPYFLRDGWIIEWPHERSMQDRWQELNENLGYFLAKFPEPAVEVGCLAAERAEYPMWGEYFVEVEEWTRKARRLDVAQELADAVRRSTGPGDRVAVFGCGGVLPPGLRGAHVADFDRDLLDAAVADGAAVGHHAVGVRTVLPDQSVDVVIVTSRLSGLWDRWQDSVLAEARRIGRKVDVFQSA
jgi:glycosyltransferase involved in cell wall biosynthesis